MMISTLQRIDRSERSLGERVKRCFQQDDFADRGVRRIWVDDAHEFLRWLAVQTHSLDENAWTVEQSQRYALHLQRYQPRERAARKWQAVLHLADWSHQTIPFKAGNPTEGVVITFF